MGRDGCEKYSDAYPVNFGNGTGVCGFLIPFFTMNVLWSICGSCMMSTDGLCAVRNMVSWFTWVLLTRPHTLSETMVKRVSSLILLVFS